MGVSPALHVCVLLFCACVYVSINIGHPSCLDMSMELVRVIQTYRWQCMECKTCTVCQQPHHEDEMMFCDKCDRGYHTFCVGMDSIPTGEWSIYNIASTVIQLVYLCFIFHPSVFSGLWVCEVCDKNFTTPKKKGGAKTPKKPKSSQKWLLASLNEIPSPKFYICLVLLQML